MRLTAWVAVRRDNPFNMSKEQWESLSGDELLGDYWQQKGSEGFLALHDGEMKELVRRFGSYEALEQHLKEKGYGLHYSKTHGFRLEAGVDTSDGIYGMIDDSRSVEDIIGDPNDKSDTVLTPLPENVQDPNKPTTEDPFKDPVDPETTKDTTDSSDSTGGGGGDIGSTGDPSTNGTAGPDGSTNPIDTPTPNPTTYPELVKIAQIAGVTVQEVISRLNSGETVDQITGKGNTPVTPPKTPETNNDHTLAGGSTGGDTDSGGDTTGDEAGDETGGDTEGGGDNTDSDGNGGNDGVDETGGNDAGDDTGGTVTHKIGGGTVAGGLGQGSGAGSGTGTGGGSGNGEGPGDGDGSGNGNGNGNGNGVGDGLGGGGGRDRPQWGQLFANAPYRPYQRKANRATGRLFTDIMLGGRNDIS